jgi:N-acetyl-gamma-glutamyl-phosphate reductase
MEKKKVSIIGAASISAAFLMKIASRHKSILLKHICSSSQAGKKVTDYHSFLTGSVDAVFTAPDTDTLIADSDVIFITRPHGEFISDTAELVKSALNTGRDIKVIDLSADFRLKDSALYEGWYGFSHEYPELLQGAAYGLTELNSDKIKDASLVANPGCYPTCAILSLAPFISKKFACDGIAINALSGVSGAGNRPSAKNIAMKVSENIFPYKVGGVHQHTPEIEEQLSVIGYTGSVTFVPHVAPFKYGIIETIYVKLNEEVDESGLNKAYEDFYAGCRFVNILSPGDFPEVKDVVGTNFVNIGLKIDKRTNTLIIISCIDNVIKGAAGQAVQNMNVMLGIDEAEGLT